MTKDETACCGSARWIIFSLFYDGKAEMHATASSFAEYALRILFICYAIVALVLAAAYGLTRKETWVKPSDFEQNQLDQGQHAILSSVPRYISQ